jgi:hypothetical protein
MRRSTSQPLSLTGTKPNQTKYFATNLKSSGTSFCSSKHQTLLQTSRNQTKKRRNTSPNPLTLKLSIHHHRLLPLPLLQYSKDLTRFKKEQAQQAAQEDAMLLCFLENTSTNHKLQDHFFFSPKLSAHTTLSKRKQ